MAPSPINSLYSKLSADLGLTKAYVRSTLLPSWWDDEAAKTPAGLAEARLYIARHAGIELNSLIDPAAKAVLSTAAKTKYKLPKGNSESDVTVARSLAEQAARFAVLGVEATFSAAGLPAAAAVRRSILDRGTPWVSLDALVAYCWSVGIPVLSLLELPKGHSKMHGMTARIGERPVIIVSKKGHPASLLFIVGHELGHIAKGHIAPDTTLVDESIDRLSDDREEKEANAYAEGLLMGENPQRFHAPNKWPKAEVLASEADKLGRELKVDPGHIALNYAHTMSSRREGDSGIFYGTANNALKLMGGQQDGSAVINKHLSTRLNWGALPESGAEFLERISGASSEVSN